MSRTIQEVKEGLALDKQIKQTLIDQANATTGKEDTTLTGAVGSLVEGFGGGSDDYYNIMWDGLQQNGKRTNYNYTFYGEGWNSNNFFPKYDIKPQGNTGEGLFRFTYNLSIDLAQRLEECGVVLDTSNMNYWMYTFSDTAITRLPEIDLTKGTSLINIFSNALKLETIDKLIVTNKCNFYTSFTNCTSLKNITFEGEIGNALNMSWCSKLSDASKQNIIDHLADLTGQTAQTLTVHKDVEARMSEEQKATITAKNWTLVVAS